MAQPLPDILPQLRIGNQAALVDFYRGHRAHFARWAQQQQQLAAPQAHQRLRDALLLFYDQVVDGRLTKAPDDLRAYIYTLAMQAAPTAAEPAAELLPAVEAGRRRRLVLLFRQLNDDSQQILMYFYFRGYNFVKVAGKMGYPNAAVARQQKISSLRTLSDLQQRSRGAAPA